METFGGILFTAIFIGIFFGDWRSWGKDETEKEYDKHEMGWFLNKAGDVISWVVTLYVIYFAFVIIKALWRLA